jgi:hypothetical protein
MGDDLELEALKLTRAENIRRKALGMTPDKYIFIGDVYDTLKSLSEAEERQAIEKMQKLNRRSEVSHER